MTPEDKMRELLGRGHNEDPEVSEGEWEQFRSRARRSLALRRAAMAGSVAVLLIAGVAAGAALTRTPVAEPSFAPGDGSTDGSDGEPRPPTADPSAEVIPDYTYPEPGADPTQVVQVFFLHGEQLTPTYRDIGGTEGIAAAAIQELLQGTEVNEGETGIFSVVPKGTELLGLTIEDGVATVDLSSEFNDTSGMGSGFEELPLAQVVWTLTQFRTVESVVIEVEGEPVDVYGSHGTVLDQPLQREDYEDASPPIVVDFPYTGQEVGSVFDLDGTANVFEANVSYRVVAENGDVLAEGFVTATCGTGCRGDFRTAVEVYVEKETQATLEVFEASAEDGSPLHTQQVSIKIVP